MTLPRITSPRLTLPRLSLTLVATTAAASVLTSGLTLPERAEAAGTGVGTQGHTQSAGTGATTTELADDRRIVLYTVRPGDTATGLATRFHAWTAELIALNRLGPDGALHVGQRLRIPVVISATEGHQQGSQQGQNQSHQGEHLGPIGVDPSRRVVSRLIIRTARHYGVDPQLALAVSWQESGWQMHHVSSTGAIGAMQVMPDTGRWMSDVLGRRLHLRDTRDNVTAGVYLLKVLKTMTAGRNNQIAAYYQGVGAIREHGWYDDTLAYVASVKAIKRRLEQGLPPA